MVSDSSDPHTIQITAQMRHQTIVGRRGLLSDQVKTKCFSDFQLIF